MPNPLSKYPKVFLLIAALLIILSALVRYFEWPGAQYAAYMRIIGISLGVIVLIIRTAERRKKPTSD